MAIILELQVGRSRITAGGRLRPFHIRPRDPASELERAGQLILDVWDSLMPPVTRHRLESGWFTAVALGPRCTGSHESYGNGALSSVTTSLVPAARGSLELDALLSPVRGTSGAAPSGTVALACTTTSSPRQAPGAPGVKSQQARSSKLQCLSQSS